MTAISLQRLDGVAVAKPSHAVRMLQVFAVALMVFPSDYVSKVVGAGGFPAAIVAYIMFLSWLAATLFGQHNSYVLRYPVRIALCAVWVVTLLSYVLMKRGLMTVEELSAADRWLLQLIDMSGVILVAAECLKSLDDIKRVLRAVTWGGAFCGIVAMLQFKGNRDLTPYIEKLLPSFSLNTTAYSDITSRGSLSRVTGTAIHPIELGVVAGMLLPLAIYLAMYDTDRSAVKRWLPTVCIGLAVPASVSRSAIIAVVLSVGVLFLSLPPVRRLKGLAMLPFALGAVFVGSHGMIGTLTSYFFAGSSDNSIAHRLNNYPYVEQVFKAAPWLGQGGGTTLIELGLIGVAVIAFFFVWPAIAGLVARAHTKDPEVRDLCAALSGAALAATACSATFDSLSFPMFANIQALVAGLIGACWLLVNRDRGLSSSYHGGY